MNKRLIGLLLAALLIPTAACATDKPTNLENLKTYPVNSMEGIISNLKQIEIDNTISADQKASLKINASEPVLINLYKTGKINTDDAKLIYQAKIKTENFKGQAYLEMWCEFDGKGRFFSKNIASAIKGNTNGWITKETPFFLKKDQKPDNIELNLVINGTGTIWIDDIKLMKAPLK